MADPKRRLSANTPGDFFVDETCIDCGTCRELAPDTFGDLSTSAYVYAQPSTPQEVRRALQAVVCCPTGSIGSGRHAAKVALGDFPMPITSDVFYCGFNAEASYGAHSYFVRHPEGNWLIDSPKYLPRLVSWLAANEGIRYIFLSHQDDVADAVKYAARFGATRIIHRADSHAQPGAEVLVEGYDPLLVGEQFTVVPVPGHTEGSCALLYDNRILFTGDHLWWNALQQRLAISREVCWYSWEEQAKSVARLQDYRFEWVLPGHGRRVHLASERMRAEIVCLAERSRERVGNR